MAVVGVRELKEHTSEIVRRVRENRETIDLSYQGKIIGRIVPRQPSPEPAQLEQIWKERRQLIEDIAEHRHDNVSAVDAVREIRREL